MRRDSLALQGHGPSIGGWLACATLLLGAAGPAMALAVTVDCDGGPADYSTIQDAVNAVPPAGPNTITVTGTCIEAVSIYGYSNLTVTTTAPATSTVSAPPGLAVFDIFSSDNVALSGLDIDANGVPIGLFVDESDVRIQRGSIFGATEAGLYAFADSEILVGGFLAGEGVTIHDNLSGVFAVQSTLNVNGQVTIEDNMEDAVILSDSDGRSIGRDLGNTVRNNGYGVSALDGGRVTFSGLNTVENNGPYGFFAFRADRLAFSGYPGSTSGPPYYGTAITGHGVWGVLAVSTTLDFGGADDVRMHTVANNGAAPLDRDAGIWIGRQAEARLRNLTVNDNYGQGVHGSLGAYVNLLFATVLDNTRNGVLLSYNSTGDLGSFSVVDGTTIGPDVAISGNGKKSIKCTTQSILAGDRSGITKIKCPGASGTGEAPVGETAEDVREASPAARPGTRSVEGDLEARIARRLATLEDLVAARPRR